MIARAVLPPPWSFLDVFGAEGVELLLFRGLRVGGVEEEVGLEAAVDTDDHLGGTGGVVHGRNRTGAGAQHTSHCRPGHHPAA